MNQILAVENKKEGKKLKLKNKNWQTNRNKKA